MREVERAMQGVAMLGGQDPFHCFLPSKKAVFEVFQVQTTLPHTRIFKRNQLTSKSGTKNQVQSQVLTLPAGMQTD